MSLKTTFAILLITVSMASAQPIRVMSYNIRYDNPADGPNAWSNRKEFLAEQTRKANPDILGVQESLPSQVAWLAEALPGYGRAGIGRDENGEGESTTIFFRLDRFELTESRTFWLSDTPEQMSKGWDAAIRRICTYVRLTDRQTKQALLVLNTHFDHVGETARRKSAELIVKQIAELNKKQHPVILLGDFNATPDSESIATLRKSLTDARLAVTAASLPQPGSFNGFDSTRPADKMIDHIFVSTHFSVDRFSMLVDVRDGRYPSDHFPVMADVLIAKAKK